MAAVTLALGLMCADQPSPSALRQVLSASLLPLCGSKTFQMKSSTQRLPILPDVAQVATPMPCAYMWHCVAQVSEKEDGRAVETAGACLPGPVEEGRGSFCAAYSGRLHLGPGHLLVGVSDLLVPNLLAKCLHVGRLVWSAFSKLRSTLIRMLLVHVASS